MQEPPPVLGRGRPGRAPKNSRNTAALGKGQCAIKAARPRGFRASCRRWLQRRQERQESREPQKKWDGEIVRGILGNWAILLVAFSALVSLIERDRPDLLSSGNPFVIGVTCASVVTVLFLGFAWLSEKSVS